MKTHIFVTALIFLTVGCQPTTDGSLLSHSGTDFTETGFQNHGDTDVKQLSGGPSEVLRLQRADGAVSSTTDTKAQLSAELTAAFYDAVVRLQMDLAGLRDETSESQLLSKLLTSKNGPSRSPIMQALKQNQLAINAEELQLNQSAGDVNFKVTAIAKAFKHVAFQYGLPEAEQKTIEQAVLKKSSMLAPLESQKSMAEANGSLLQGKLNEAIVAAAKKNMACSSLQLLKTAADNFYSKEAPYVLPALIQNKGIIVSKFISDAFAQCAKAGQESHSEMMTQLTSVSDAVTFDLGSLDLYLTPKGTFNWEDFQNFKLKFHLKENASSATLAFEDISCKLNGQELALREAQQNGDYTEAAFDLPIAGAFPLVMQKSELQKGVTLLFTANNSKVTYFNKMTLTKIKPNTLVPAIHFVAGDKTIAQFKFSSSEMTQASEVTCELKTKTK